MVGHILFSPIELAGHPDLGLMGLGPMAVKPERQGRGIGSELVLQGVSAVVCTQRSGRVDAPTHESTLGGSKTA